MSTLPPPKPEEIDAYFEAMRARADALTTLVEKEEKIARWRRWVLGAVDGTLLFWVVYTRWDMRDFTIAVVLTAVIEIGSHLAVLWFWTKPAQRKLDRDFPNPRRTYVM